MSEVYIPGSTSCEEPVWRSEPDGTRTCSHCGSLHPQDFIDIMYGYIQDPDGGFKFEPSDKGYKIYANRPGTGNASQGGIKFYTNHIEPEYAEAINAAWQLALPISRHRFEQRWGGSHAKGT